MATNAAFKRLTREYIDIVKNPVPFIKAKPLESNILEWHYILTGPPDSPYEGGEYHGKLIFPSEYPYKPPSIKMLTPNGRFQIDYRLCLTMSDYHPGLWNPQWSVSTILTGLLSFMLEDKPTTGSINTTTEEKIRLSKNSHYYNINNPVFRKVFPELCVTTVVENELNNVMSINLNPPLCKKNGSNINIEKKNFNTKDINTNDDKKVILNNMNDTITSFIKPINDNKWKIIFGLLIFYLIVVKVLTRMEIKVVSQS
ncbi:ubiquitin-conjugating enzyme/RWD-like protein [Neocallimastix lanati (nom. inval.)]|jgi:ubiquitin-protein ligase|nr:ubiquitin-conjugating enzyme/RWD-like protein [Neocallimastix sp. JGI-2020a]